jgi:pimeloyl-ACP methyl ester carboxylesterase
LVLLAGQANSRHWWDPVRADFVARYRTIGIDALGTGHSDAPTAAEYSTPRFAADVIAVLDEIGIERAHVYGTSMGGRVAQWVAIDHPERVGALVLGCTTPGGSAAAVAGQDVIGSLAGPPDRARHALLELMFTPGWREQHPGPYSVLGDEAMSAAARRAHRRASAAHDASRELGRIAAPTLVLHGTDDQFCPVENARLLAEAIPGAELALLPDARHAYFIEQRDDASRRVLDFLAAQPLPSAQQFVL